MSETQAGVLTDEIRSYVGREGPEETAVAGLPEMVRYAQAVSVTPTANPVLVDERTAAETTFGGVIGAFQFYSVPFTTVAPPSTLKEDGIPAAAGLFNVELPPIPLPRTMAGGLDVRYHRPIRPGDVLTRKTRIADIAERQGRSGPLVFTTMETTYRDGDGSPVVVVRQTIISR